MCTYLKNMEGYKLNDLKLKEFDFIQEMFDRALKWGRIVRIKSLLDAVRITVAHVCVNAAQRKDIDQKPSRGVNTFKDFRTELVEGKEKRAGTELAQEITKKQKVEDDKETTKIKKLMEIIPDEEEVAIDAIPLLLRIRSIKVGSTIITSLKALDEGYSSKNYVRKFLKALHPKWRAKVTAIEE
ncbi:hypothetical protein Tco_0540978 [Tanacetum coccineum]